LFRKTKVEVGNTDTAWDVVGRGGDNQTQKDRAINNIRPGQKRIGKVFGGERFDARSIGNQNGREAYE